MESEAFYYHQQFENSPGKQPQYYGDPSTPVYDTSKIQHQEASPTDSESRQSLHYAGWSTVVQHTENSVSSPLVSPRFSEYDYVKRSNNLSTDSIYVLHYKQMQQTNRQKIIQQQNYDNFMNSINNSDIINNYHQYDKNPSSGGAGFINSNCDIMKNDLNSNSSNNNHITITKNSNNSDSVNNHNTVSLHNSQHNHQLLQQLQQQQPQYHQHLHHTHHLKRCLHQGQF